MKDLVQNAIGLLGRGWWNGVGVLIGFAALAVGIWLGLRAPAPVDPLELKFSKLENLDSGSATSYLRVGRGSTYKASSVEEDYRDVVLEDGAVIEVSGQETWTLNTLSLSIGKDVQIIATGGKGDDGAEGLPGKNGGRCANGTDGEAGKPGHPGHSGVDVTIQSKQIRLQTDGVRVDTSGGRGGNGGSGGRAGNGGRGSRTDSCGGGNGGKGGNGGTAGAGGDGGDLIVRYVNATADADGEVVIIDRHTVAGRFEHLAQGGSHGEQGKRGEGGGPGAGRGASVLTFDSQPAGSPGSDGESGGRPPYKAKAGNSDIRPIL